MRNNCCMKAALVIFMSLLRVVSPAPGPRLCPCPSLLPCNMPEGRLTHRIHSGFVIYTSSPSKILIFWGAGAK